MSKRTSVINKQRIIRAVALKTKPIQKIAKQYHLSCSTLYSILRDNKEQYDKIIEELKNQISGASLLTAEKAIRKITNKKLNESSALSLSQTAKNLIDNTKDNASVNILFNLPENRSDLLNLIKNAGTEAQEIDTSITLEAEKKENNDLMP